MAPLTRLLDRLRDKVYRRAYVEDMGDAYLATQIQVLREQRKLSQTDFADLIGVRQSQVCRWENVNNTSWQLRSLKKIARALDLVLTVRFESFGRALSDLEGFTRERMERHSFEQDPVFENAVATASLEIVTTIREGAPADVSLPAGATGSEMQFYAKDQFEVVDQAERAIA